MKKSISKKLRLNAETLFRLSDENLVPVGAGTGSRAFSDCAYCSVGGGSACVSDGRCTDPKVCGK